MPLSLAAGTLGAGIVGGLGNIISGLFGSSAQSKANETNVMLAREGRDWQSVENQKARDFQERMWNAQNYYNSPANQRRLAQEAGYNPYLLVSNGLGSGAGSIGSALMSGAPDVARVSPVNPMSGLGAASDTFANMVRMLPQVEQVESNKRLQSSEIVKNLTDSIIKAYDELGAKGAREVWSNIAPYLKSLDLSGSRSDIRFNEFLKDELSARYNLDMDSLNKEIEYNLGRKYGEQKIQSNLQKLSYEISEIVGRLNTMNVQNDALMKQTAADMVVKAAHAFMLRKEGDKFIADTQTANEMREWVVKSAEHLSKIKEVDAQFKQAEWDSSSALIGYMTSREGREKKREVYRRNIREKSDALVRTFDKLFGEYVKVSSGGSSSGYGSTTTEYFYNE